MFHLDPVRAQDSRWRAYFQWVDGKCRDRDEIAVKKASWVIEPSSGPVSSEEVAQSVRRR